MADLIPTILFYLFSAAVVGSAVMVIASRNPVHSVFFLILAFFNSAGLFLLLGAEYLAMTLVIVYVGAVAVLFLFVVMMLDVNFAELRQGFLRYLPVGLIIAGLVFGELLLAYSKSIQNTDTLMAASNATPDAVTNTRALGQILYTKYVYLFQVSGLVLLVAMIGAITLVLRSRPGVRRQKVAHQLARQPEDCMTIVQVKTGEGA